MEPFTIHRGIAVPLLRANVDTDAIIPSREMKRVGKTGLGQGLFAGWRYRNSDSREPEPDFVLNQARYAGARLAPSFGVIFRDNCIRNGVLPIVLDEAKLIAIAEDSSAGGPVTVDLRSCQVFSPGGSVYSFDIPSAQREMLLEGLDPVALTLKLADRIEAFQRQDRLERPWIYLNRLREPSP